MTTDCTDTTDFADSENQSIRVIRVFRGRNFHRSIFGTCTDGLTVSLSFFPLRLCPAIWKNRAWLRGFLNHEWTRIDANGKGLFYSRSLVSIRGCLSCFL
jgi:hypothetical protein